MRYTYYPRRDVATDGERGELDRDSLLYWLRDAEPAPAGGKSALPLVTAATFLGDRRGNDRVTAVHWLGLDLDQPTSDPDARIRAVHAALGGVEVYGYSTISSAPGAWRLRAIVPYDAPADADEHRASWRVVARVLGRAGVEIDRACSDPARGYYLWAVPESGAYWYGHVAGCAWPVAYAARRELDRAAAARQPRVTITGDVVDRARAYLARMDGAISGARGHDATYRAALALVRGFALDEGTALALLDEWNERCAPPWSERDLRRKVEQASRAERVELGYLLRDRSSR